MSVHSKQLTLPLSGQAVHRKSINRQPLALSSLALSQSNVSNGLTVNRELVNRLGFTLIELLVVISIISLLVAAATVSWTNAQQKGRDSKRKADLKTVQQALESFYQANGHYPPWDGSNEQVGWCYTLSNSNVQADVYNRLVTAYVSSMPTDPAYGSSLQAGGYQQDYLYKKVATGQYELAAVLENTNDPDKGGPYDYSACTGGANSYNYKVTNP